MTILVTGATGNVGCRVAELVHASGAAIRRHAIRPGRRRWRVRIRTAT